MSVVNLVPALSAWDPALTAEGTIDPLGLAVIAERMAVKLIPGVRERQVDPRWLVAGCVGALIDSWFDHERLAADDRSPPSMVYEWFVAEALVRNENGAKDLALPGRNKIKSAIGRGESVNAANYLKTASVFGFQGVYRVLSVTMQLTDKNGLLLENGYELLTSWASEHDLNGFVEGVGSNSRLRDRLRRLVAAGLESADTSKMKKTDWSLISQYLSPQVMGEQVCNNIWLLLHEAGEPSWRGFFLDILKSRNAQGLQKSEREFHLWLLEKDIPDELKVWLKAILDYEAFATLLEQSFKSLLWGASETQPVKLSSLIQTKAIQFAMKEISVCFDNAMDTLGRLDDPGLALEFEKRFQDVSVRTGTGEEWLNLLLTHHEEIQKGKPPVGKAPWVERFDADRVLTRSKYREEEDAIAGKEYVNQYRASPLNQFVRYLGRLK